MAKPKVAASGDGSPAAYIADRIASEAAGRPSEEHRNAAAQIEVESVAAAEPSPCDDMHDASDVWTWSRHLAIVPPPGTGVPCANCQRQHVGPCTIYDILIADMNTMQFYAEVFLPAGPWLHHLRGDLYKLMGEIYRVLNFEEPTVIAEKYGALRVAMINLKAQCDLHIELGI